MDCRPLGSSVHWDSPGKNTGVGCHPLLQGIFPTQGIKPGSLALQANSLPSEPPGKPVSMYSLVYCTRGKAHFLYDIGKQAGTYRLCQYLWILDI